MGITRHTWKAWHNYAGLAMVVLAVVHVISYWKVFIGMTKNIFGGEKI